MSFAEFFASESYLQLYSGLLVGLTLLGILISTGITKTEKNACKAIIAILDGVHTKTDRERYASLVQLNQLTDARLLTHACPADPSKHSRSGKYSGTSIARAAGIYLGLITATAADRHHSEGLRPARIILEDEYKRLHRTLRGFGDFIVRFALLGTFMGLIAALSIASANIGSAEGSEATQSEHMRMFIQALLATAANKFWISAVGIGCALLIQIFEATRDLSFIRRVSDAFDRAIANAAVTRLWCPNTPPPTPLGSDVDEATIKRMTQNVWQAINVQPINKAIEDIAQDMRSNANHWTLPLGSGNRGSTK